MKTISSPRTARSRFIAACVGAAAFCLMSGSHAQSQQPPIIQSPGPATGQQPVAPVDPQGLSCDDLKAQLKSAGTMSILSGPKGGWGDTFYGPAVPRCQFWQMPQFAYVRARNGLCGVGYICVDKLSID